MPWPASDPPNSPGPTFDSEGYLAEPLAWTPEVAEELARGSGLPRLTAEHWKVLSCHRESRARTGRQLRLTELSALTGLSVDQLRRLFPFRSAELIAKLAGSPKPSS